MSKEFIIVFGILFYIVTIGLLFGVLELLQNKDKKNYRKEISELERQKNLILSPSLIAELKKAEPLMDHETMKSTYEKWQKKYDDIKEVDMPRITDDLLVAEELYAKKDYKTLQEKLSQIELDIFYVKAKANFLLDDVKEITLSEERNRETITKLKASYREILKKYHDREKNYKEVHGPIELQFERIDKLFSAFEVSMEKRSYPEVGKIVKTLDDLIGNLGLVIEEAPVIIQLGSHIIPRKMKEIDAINEKLKKEGYNLDYLNIPYNLTEANKKITDIFARLNVLNIEDSIFELKTITEYLDTIYNGFDKERKAKKSYEEYIRTLYLKIHKLTKINDRLLSKLKDIQYSYDLTDEEVSVVYKMKEDLATEQGEYDDIVMLGREKSASYSHVYKKMEVLNIKVIKTEEMLDLALRTFGSLKEDEIRAREQLGEMKELLNEAKEKIKTYKLPIIPDNYYVELSEATESIGNMVAELEKTPISIKVLNTRVDTARDLVLKLYNTTKEILKTAKMAETTIVYGNRYRTINNEVDIGLQTAEKLFFQGEYKKSLKTAINAINIIEPGIYQRLMNEYQS